MLLLKLHFKLFWYQRLQELKCFFSELLSLQVKNQKEESRDFIKQM